MPEEIQDLALTVFSDYEITGIEQNMDKISVTFDRSDYSVELSELILERLKYFDPDIEIIDIYVIGEKNWNEEWEKNVPEIKVNDRIGIAPVWKLDKLDTEIKIKINPKMSFGTGDHASTRLVCRLMEDTVQKDSFWVDAGTGTGILAILAIKLGAKECFAFDNNEWSIDNSIENIRLNNVEDKITIEEQDIDTFEIPRCDGIAANIFLNIIIRSFKKFRKALNDGGDLIVAGILTYDKDQVIENALANGFEVIRTIEEDEWTGFHFRAV